LSLLSSEKANRSYFREAYRTGKHGWAAEDPSPYAVKFLNQLKHLVPGGRLLDVGCGEGRHAIVASRMGFKVMGIDYERLALNRARRFAEARGAIEIVFRRANILCLPPSYSGFDIVLDYGCLHHQRKSDWRAYQSSILGVMAPQAFYVLSVFSPKFPLFHGSRRRWHIAHGAYRRSFTQRDIRGLFGCNFEVVEMIEENGGQHGFWHVLFRRRGSPVRARPGHLV
jgi:SAM-dependent methyltransferase